MSQAAAILSSAPDHKIRVMVVDDAVVFRGLVTRWLNDEPDMAVVGSCRNGYEALENLNRVNPDVVVLDIEMPVLDGLATLPLLLARKPNITVIISSTVTRRNAEVGIRALSLGAADYVSKPETNREITQSPEFRRELIGRIRALGRRQIEKSDRAHVRLPAPQRERVEEAPAAIKLRKFSSATPEVLVIGSSTGGPQALQALLRGLEPVLPRIPVLITQHMPATFTTILAEHLSRTTNRPAREGVHGETLECGTIYVAPGGRHMTVARDGERATIAIEDGPPINFCRPSVDALFKSAAAAFGAAALALVLTGMGSDGEDGAIEIADAGGTVIAQDEESSVIWGMPGSAAEAGACAAVLPLDDIAPKVADLVRGGGA